MSQPYDPDFEIQDAQAWQQHEPQVRRPNRAKGKGREQKQNNQGRFSGLRQPDESRAPVEPGQPLGVPGPSSGRGGHGRSDDSRGGQNPKTSTLLVSRPPPSLGGQGFEMPALTFPSESDTGAGEHHPSHDLDYYGERLHPVGFRNLNFGDLAERSGQDPDDEFLLPGKRCHNFKDRFYGTQFANMLHIGTKTETHLALPTNVDMDDAERVLIWGRLPQVLEAKLNLSNLVTQIENDRDEAAGRVGGWEKVNVGPSIRMQEVLEIEYALGEVERKYRHPPPTGKHFSFVGVFQWPVEEMNPQSALGLSYEGLDPIRFKHEVFILYQRKNGIFRVLGEDEENVETAVKKIHGTLCEMSARARKPTKMIIVEAPSTDLPGTKVTTFDDHDLIGRQVTVKRIPENSGIQTRLSGPRPTKQFLAMWSVKRVTIDKANFNFMKRAFQRGIDDVLYTRGIAKLRIYIGRLVLFGYRKPVDDGSFELLEYLEMARNPQTTGELIRSIGSADAMATDEETAIELMAYLSTHNTVFKPIEDNSDLRSMGLESVERPDPQISITMDIAVYDKLGRSRDVRLDVIFQRIPNSKNYRPAQTRWLDSGGQESDVKTRRKGPLDIIVQDLEKDLAYQIELRTQSTMQTAGTNIDFEEFVRGLKLEEIPDITDPVGPPENGMPDTRRKITRIQFTNHSGLSVISLIQKTKYQYGISRTQYIFEITKYESLPVIEVSAKYPDGIPVSYREHYSGREEICWGCSFYNEEWDHRLRQNETLEIGERVRWNKDLKEFTPLSSRHVLDPSWEFTEGFEELISRLREFMGFIRAAQLTVAVKKNQSQARREARLLRG